MSATYFVGHGAPTLPLQDIPARDFLRGLGRSIEQTQGRPEAILCVSAHWETARPAVATAGQPATIHDFSGFPPELYKLRYPAPGAPDAAERAAQALEAAGFACDRDPRQGLDHGAWVPLMLMWPEAQIPLAQIALQPKLGPAHHLALGAALAPLARERILVIGSGGIVHNLRHFFSRPPESSTVPAWAEEFEGWLVQILAQGDRTALADYRRLAPHAAMAQPSDEHLLPLLVALGAAGPQAKGRALHRSFDSSLSFGSFIFQA